MSKAQVRWAAGALVAIMVLLTPAILLAGDDSRPDPHKADSYKDEMRWITKEIVQLKHERLPRAEGAVKEATEQLIAAHEHKAEATGHVIKAYHEGTHADVLAAQNAKEAASYKVTLGWEKLGAREKQQYRAIKEEEASHMLKYLDESLVPYFQKMMRNRRDAAEAWKVYGDSVTDDVEPAKLIEGKVQALRKDMEFEVAEAEFEARRRSLDYANRAIKYQSREMGTAVKELFTAEMDLVKAQRAATEARILAEKARADRDTVKYRIEQINRAAEQREKQESAKNQARKGK